MMTRGTAAPLTPERLALIERMREIREAIHVQRWRMIEVIQDLHA